MIFKNILRSFFLQAFVVFYLLSGPLYSQITSQREQLENLSQELEIIYKAEKEEAERIADSLGIPVRQELPGDVIIELQGFIDGYPDYYVTYNLEGATVIKTSQLWPGGTSGLDLTGAGQTLGMWDGGATRLSHQEFEGRAIQADNATSLSGHATHVGATMIAGGVDEDAKGMSYEANLDAYDWNNDASQMAAAAANGLQVSQHSYGSIAGWRFDEGTWYWYGVPSISEVEDYKFGFYDSRAHTWDLISNNAPNYLIVKSVGNSRGTGPAPGTGHYVWDGNSWAYSTTTRDINGGDDGYDCIPTYGNAKNIISVGAVTAGGAMASFSSWGPTNDGRIKPDIVAKGVSVYSATATSNSSYGSWSGTSMSGPMVSGSIGLLLQHHQELNETSPSLRASTIKALILHTADALDGHPEPNYRSGWGMMNTQKAAELMSENAEAGGNSNIREFTLSDEHSIEIDVISDGNPLKATIVWDDPAAEPLEPSLNPTTLMLVNDLDMRIIDSEENVYYPWILDPENPSELATTGDNFRDNVEQILIMDTEAWENYTITISHKDNLADSYQEFSLIVSGIVPENPFKEVVFNVMTYDEEPVEDATITISKEAKSKSSNNEDKDEESGEWIHWDTGENVAGVGTNSSANFHIASRWEPEDLTEYDGKQIKQISFVPKYEECIYTIKIWEGPNAVEVYSQYVHNPVIDEWNIVELNLPYIIDSSDELWFGVNINTQGGRPAGRDGGPQVPGKGNMIFFNGEWSEVSDLNSDLTQNWNLQAYVVPVEPMVLNTGADGSVSFEALSGSYSYIVEKESYLPAEGSFNVESFDMEVNVVLYDEDGYYTLTLEASPENAGVVSGGGTFPADATVEISAVANTGFDFVNWTDTDNNSISDESDYQFTMPEENLQLVANFSLSEYTLSVEADPVGSGYFVISPDQDFYNHNDIITITAYANDGYSFEEWQEDGEGISNNDELIYTMPADDVVLTAVFEEEPEYYTLLLVSDPIDAGTLSGSGNYLEGEYVNVSATANEGYVFINWIDSDDNTLSNNSSFLYSMPGKDITLIANFSLVNYTGVLEKDEVIVFPNPFNDKITLRNTETLKQVVIRNILGQKVTSVIHDGSDKIVFEAGGFPQGVYLIKLYYQNGDMQVRKIIKE